MAERKQEKLHRNRPAAFSRLMASCAKTRRKSGTVRSRSSRTSIQHRQRLNPSAAERRKPEPQGPSAAEQHEQAQAYQKSSAEMDRQAEASGISTKDMEITFERFLASLYMTGMMQLGLMHEQGHAAAGRFDGRAPDHRHAGLDSGKNQGQSTSKEENFCRMRCTRCEWPMWK